VNGTHSSWVDVTSGVPQGSVLGPALFLLYINDIHEHIQSKIKLFADDSILYREIEGQSDLEILQKDLDTLAAWSNTWLMRFNVKKCAIMSITHKRSPQIYEYTLLGENLNRVEKHDYLGVTISHNLKWNDHCNKVIKKASRTLGLLRRTLSPCTRQVKAQAYQSLIRPQMDYASEVWNPDTVTEIKRLEQVQRNSARFVYADYRRRTHVSGLVQDLNWDPLHTRRLIQQATMFYKIHFGLVNITPPPCIERASQISYRKNHPFKYTNTISSRLNVYKYAFYPRVITIWNRLPRGAVLHVTPSIPLFHTYAIPAIRELSPLHGCNVL
jgi:hypothetical protein